MKICPIQHCCPADRFDAGVRGKSKYPANHHVRETIPCKKFIDMSCEMSITIQLFLGETLACSREKIQRIKKELSSPSDD